jgi:RHH-type proline utilization regulon transcriptional repressor/proline dehydrogenase/delta 1-pyrroline-5-carboxylate dehydrogenase
MGEGLYEKLVREGGYRTRIYAPVGGHRDLLAYLVRRLLENGANSSFVHQLADETMTDEEILADPVAKVEAVGGSRHPAIPLPQDLFAPERRNSGGLDLDDRVELERVAKAVAEPLPFLPKADKQGNYAQPSHAEGAEAAFAEQSVGRALAAFPVWASRSIEQRAACLDRLADLLERERDTLMALAVQEAKKTIPDALGEVREAVDFCRYYAAQARSGCSRSSFPGPTGERNVMRMEGRGVWVCVAPWNFPLAIFLGQVTAALVTGNTVVAKPAPQTPEIAAFAVGLAHGAGVPEDALILARGGRDGDGVDRSRHA